MNDLDLKLLNILDYHYVKSDIWFDRSLKQILHQKILSLKHPEENDDDCSWDGAAEYFQLSEKQTDSKLGVGGIIGGLLAASPFIPPKWH